MAISFVQGTGAAGDVVVARSADGVRWTRHAIKDVDMRNSAKVNARAKVTFRYTGPGPQTQINDGGDVCVACIVDGDLQTLLWPADELRLKPVDRVVADVPLERCGIMKFDRQIAWFQLHHHAGRFYLLTTPQSDFKDFVRVYELTDTKVWRLLGEPLAGKEGSVAWDDASGELYVGLQASRPRANATHPAVFKWDAASRRWQELASPAAGLRERFGITSYPGGGCPCIVAHDGMVWAFWWQEDDCRLQAAAYTDGNWQSCAKAYLEEGPAGEPQRVERESFGQGGGIYETGLTNLPQCKGTIAFRDRATGDLVVFVADGHVGLTIRDGRVSRIAMRRPVGAGRSRDALSAPVGEGFHALGTDAMTPHTVHLSRTGNTLYRQATMPKDGKVSACDVFVFKLTPRPFADFGATISEDRRERYDRVVSAVTPGSPAAVGGVRVGDRLVAVRAGSQPEEELGPDLMPLRFLPPGPAQVRVERRGATETVTVRIPAP
jgi:hypothetical protein